MKTAIVTGAGSGIGRTAAIALANRGYAVALAGRTLKKLQSVAAEIESQNGTALCIPTDVSNPKSVETLIKKTAAKWHRIDVLVNNAGLAIMQPLADFTVKQWQATIDTNLSSVFYATRAVWPIMQKQKSGTIINISSLASRDPFTGLGVYGAAKAAINLLTLAAAREGHPAGIRVLCIAPGAVDTPMLRDLDANFPDHLMLRPEQLGQLIADAAEGSQAFSPGETLFIHRPPA